MLPIPPVRGTISTTIGIHQRNPPGDDGHLVRICGTVTRAGPVKAGCGKVNHGRGVYSELRGARVHFQNAFLFVDFRGFLFVFFFFRCFYVDFPDFFSLVSQFWGFSY